MSQSSDLRKTLILVSIRDNSEYFPKILESLRKEFFACKKILKNFYYLSTKFSVNEALKRFNRILNEWYPMLFRLYFKSTDIIGALKHFESEYNDKLTVDNLVAKRWFGKKETNLSYFKGSLDQAIGKARLTNTWIDYLLVSGKHFKLSINRRGVIRVYYVKNFDAIKFILIKLVTDLASRLKIFDKRGRIEADKLRPMIIKFATNIFESITGTKKFLEIIENYKFINYSVLHAGNPYVYITILDKIDGSSFSVRTYMSNSVIIIPQLRTSAASLLRFTEHILDHVGEGEIKDFTV